jgi:glycosyltransferase involved in cell wall biosynthesis
MNKIKVLSIIETLGRGGAERMLLNTLPKLQEEGILCEVVILFQQDDLAEELEANSMKVHRLNLSYKWNILEGVYKLFKLVKKEKYHIIHAHLFFAYFYTALVKVFHRESKTVVTLHNLAYKAYPANTLQKKIRKKIDCFVLKAFDSKVAVSDAVKKHFKKHCNVQSKVIYNALPIKEFSLYKTDRKNKSNKFRVLTAGRFVDTKGHSYLLEAIKILNQDYLNFEFLFVGRGGLEARLKKEAPSNVVFISELTHSELMNLYNEVDIVVVPSVAEAFGLVVCEAMVMEKPIVTTKVDGIVEIVNHNKEALLVPPKDALSLANNIEILYLNKALQKELVYHASQRVKEFDIDVIIDQWKALYVQLLEKNMEQ